MESVDKEKWKDYHNSMMSDRSDIIELFVEWYTLRKSLLWEGEVLCTKRIYGGLSSRAHWLSL